MAGSPAGALLHRGLAWGCLLLAFCGWCILLGGVASLQQACSGGMVTTLTDLAQLTQAAGRRLLQNPESVVAGFPGSVGYLAPVGCNKFLSYVWWIWAFDLFTLVLLAVGITTLIGTMRGTLISISAALLVLLMDTANTFLYFNHIQGLSGTVASRARVIVAGSIISAIAYFLLIGVIGWHNEDASVEAPFDAEAAGMTRKRRGAGFGSLFRRKEGERREEEAMGAGTPGSPRMIQVPRPPAGGAPAPIGAAVPTSIGTVRPGPISGGAPAVAMPAATTVTTATAVPVSTHAGPAV